MKTSHRHADGPRVTGQRLMRRLVAVCLGASALALVMAPVDAQASTLVAASHSPRSQLARTDLRGLRERRPASSDAKAAEGADSVLIPLAAACRWAYPGRASGRTKGSGYEIVCLNKQGHPLGGFGGSHSLNAWCANPSHTAGMFLPNPGLVKGTWECLILAPPSGNLKGNSVAISDSTAVVGLPGADHAIGAVYVYARSHGLWHHRATLDDPRAAALDEFGWSVAVSSGATGTYIVVGNNGYNGKKGFVYIYKESGNTWHRQGTLSAPNSAGQVIFGQSVAISGNYLAISSSCVTTNRGTVYVYHRIGAFWVMQASLASPRSGNNNLFGNSVGIADDHTLVIGAPLTWLICTTTHSVTAGAWLRR
jgi:hypothetical protein